MDRRQPWEALGLGPPGDVLELGEVVLEPLVGQAIEILGPELVERMELIAVVLVPAA